MKYAGKHRLDLYDRLSELETPAYNSSNFSEKRPQVWPEECPYPYDPTAISPDQVQCDPYRKILCNYILQYLQFEICLTTEIQAK
jgi:hypothetical protein